MTFIETKIKSGDTSSIVLQRALEQDDAIIKVNE